MGGEMALRQRKMMYVVAMIVLVACGLLVGGWVFTHAREHQTAVVKTTTVYQTQTVETQPEASAEAAPAPPTEQVPSGPSYDEVWNRCYQAGENDVDQYYTSSDLAAYCRDLAHSVATH